MLRMNTNYKRIRKNIPENRDRTRGIYVVANPKWFAQIFVIRIIFIHSVKYSQWTATNHCESYMRSILIHWKIRWRSNHSANHLTLNVNKYLVVEGVIIYGLNEWTFTIYLFHSICRAILYVSSTESNMFTQAFYLIRTTASVRNTQIRNTNNVRESFYKIIFSLVLCHHFEM